MAETFLEEQLRRIREMSEQMSRVRNRAAELSLEVERDRALMKRTPLHEVRDFRRFSSISDELSVRAEAHDARPPRSAARRRRK
jgi:hypothetical protein